MGAVKWTPVTLTGIKDAGQFAWPGGYELFYIGGEDGEIRCVPCATEEAKEGFPYGPLYYQGSAADTDGPVECGSCYRVIVEGEEES